MKEKLTFTEYLMSCLQKEALEKYWREHYGKETTDKTTSSDDKKASRKQTTSGTTTKPVS